MLILTGNSTIGLLGAIWTYKCEAAHEAHLEHIKEENGGEEPEKVKYPYIGKLEKVSVASISFDLCLNVFVGFPMG